MAWCYDELAALLSAGRIAAAKSDQLEMLEPGDRVLYAGVGRGVEALCAARRGVRVTALDRCPAMLDRFAVRLARAGLPAQVVCEDLFSHRPASAYDVVVANFVLNVFAPEEMAAALTHLARLLRPGGRLLVPVGIPPESQVLILTVRGDETPKETRPVLTVRFGNLAR